MFYDNQTLEVILDGLPEKYSTIEKPTRGTVLTSNAQRKERALYESSRVAEGRLPAMVAASAILW